MRSFLNKIYIASGYLAAMFLVGILFAIMWQVISRWLGRTADATEVAGMFLAASTFLGLAYTFREGAHVRINLIVGHLPAAIQRWVEFFNCLVALGTVAFVSWNMWILAFQSVEFEDVSPGLLAIPFWIPQMGVALGLTLFAVALIDEVVWLLQGGRPRYDAPDAAHNAPVA